MNNQNQNLGEQFKSAVSDAINNGDFQKLNFLVTDTVTDVIADASTQIKKAASDVQKEFQNTSATSDIYKNIKNYQQQQAQRNQQLNNKTRTKQQQTQNQPFQSVRQQFQNTRPAPGGKLLPIYKTKNVGQISSILYIVFGGIGTGFSIITLLIGMVFSLVDFPWPIGIYILILILLSGFLLMIRQGLNQRGRLNRMKRYISLCDDNMYVNIKYLAQQTGKNISYVLKDVKKMLQLGFFPEGHLDAKGDCLMLDTATYQEYLRIEQERSALAQEEAKKEKDKENLSAEQQELQAMLQEGKDYIDKLHHLNDIIEDASVSEKLYRMENLLKEIFERVQESPEQMPKMRKLMSYYLPTTIKLLQSYSEFDDVSAPGQDIISAKAEIEKTIDIINEAFVELLNKLFQTSAFDAATDAQVLQTMLAKEGLTKNKFTEEIKHE